MGKMQISFRFFLCFITLLCSAHGYANMASPDVLGSSTKAYFGSRGIEIKSEVLDINISNDFQISEFNVLYNIDVSQSGEQIPFVFVSLNYFDNFHVYLDEVEILLKNDSLPIDTYQQYFSENEETSIEKQFNVAEFLKSGRYKIEELQYFKVNLTKGLHKIKVIYNARPGYTKLNPIKVFELKYDFSPSQYWKSFDSLTLRLQFDGDWKSINTNFNGGYSQVNNVREWRMNYIPPEVFSVKYKPVLSPIGNFVVYMGEFGVSLFLIIPLILLHLYLAFRFKKEGKNKLTKRTLVVGFFAVLFLYNIAFLFSENVQDYFIGENASKNHGYYIIGIFFLVPAFAFCYGIFLLIYALLLKKIKPNKSTH